MQITVELFFKHRILLTKEYYFVMLRLSILSFDISSPNTLYNQLLARQLETNQNTTKSVVNVICDFFL